MAADDDGPLDGHLEIRIAGLTRSFFIGVNESEKGRRQRVVIDVRMYLPESGRHDSDDLAETLNYSTVVAAIDRLAASEAHIALVETLAERIADAALADARVVRAAVTVEKLEAVADGRVGVRLERRRDRPPGGG